VYSLKDPTKEQWSSWQNCQYLRPKPNHYKFEGKKYKRKVMLFGPEMDDLLI